MARSKPGVATLAYMKRSAIKYLENSHAPYKVSLHHAPVAYAKGILLLVFVDKSAFERMRSEYRVAFWSGETDGMVFDLTVQTAKE